jgi:hypothetical protein
MWLLFIACLSYLAHLAHAEVPLHIIEIKC